MKTIILLLTTLLTISNSNAISQTVGFDPTFGEGGIVRTNLVEQIKADDIRESIVAVQPDGKLIIAIDLHGVRPKIIRLNQDGSLDRSLKSPVLTIMDLNAMILQDDGKIVVAGRRFSRVDNRNHFKRSRRGLQRRDL